MKNNKFDAIIFGNGMTLNLFGQLKKHVPNEKLYLFDIDEFLKKFIDNKLSFKDEQYIEKIFYKKKTIENSKYFSDLKDVLRQYYLNNDSNIEKILGRDLFKKESEIEYNISLIKSLFPALYNIWFNIVYKYIEDNSLKMYMSNFYSCLRLLLSCDHNIYTTNFDYLTDGYLNTKHLHGSFIKNMNNYQDVKLASKNEDEFNFKHVWGYNGIGKANFIYERSIENSDKYFDFSFFYDENIKIDNLLVYGMSFQRLGAITEEFLKVYPKYREDNYIGTVVDEHILLRIAGLQNLNKLKNVTVSYYSEKEKNYFESIFKYYGIKNIKFLHSTVFNLKI